MNLKVLIFAVLLLPFFIISCDKQGDNIPPLDRANTSSVLLAEITPMFTSKVNKDSIAVAFVQTAVPYYLNLRDKNSSELLKTIDYAISANVPIALYVYDKTREISKVEKASEAAIARYKELLSNVPEAPNTKESLAPIPSLAALNTLWSELSSAAIPFPYPVDGCFARAHKMRQMIKSKGYDSAKQFAYGNLAARGLSGCCVEWGYHVAPVVRYRNASNVIEVVILDPSLFTGPVSIPTWINKIKDNTCKSGASVASQVLMADNVYVRSSNGAVMYDDNYVSTNCVVSSLFGMSGCTTPPPLSFYNCL